MTRLLQKKGLKQRIDNLKEMSGLCYKYEVYDELSKTIAEIEWLKNECTINEEEKLWNRAIDTVLKALDGRQK